MQEQDNNLDKDNCAIKLKSLPAAVVDDIVTFEDYYKEQIEEGYISENGTPLKCVCGCKDFKQVNQYYGEGWIEEYSLQCTNKKCLKLVGHWSFGNWEV